MIEDTMFDNDCYAVFMEEEHEKEKHVRDNISRQAVIDLFEERMNGWTLEEAIPIVDRFVKERERCDDVWYAVVTIRDVAECVKQEVEKYLPSAESEIVRCRDCKHVQTTKCPFFKAKWGYTDDDYCSCGERREDGEE